MFYSLFANPNSFLCVINRVVRCFNFDPAWPGRSGWMIRGVGISNKAAGSFAPTFWICAVLEISIDFARTLCHLGQPQGQEMRIFSTLLMAALAAAALRGSAEAAAFTSSAAFLAATTGTTTEDYATTTAGQLVPNGSTLDGPTYSFTTTGNMGGIITNLYNSFTGLSLAAKQVSGPLSASDFFFGGNSFTVDFPSPVTAVGVFANVNLNSGTYTLSATPGSATTGSGSFDTDTFVFVGLTSATPFSSATFVSNDLSLGSYNIPEIIYGAAGSVPEPASLVMLGSALLGLGFCRRRKRIV